MPILTYDGLSKLRIINLLHVIYFCVSLQKFQLMVAIVLGVTVVVACVLFHDISDSN